MKIAILYICTGKYDVFWDEFYTSCEQYFYPSVQKEYFVFTDSKAIIESKNDRIHTFYQVRSGWPYDTLLRYQWFCTVSDKLEQFDYCYYLNANSKFLKEITPEIIPYPNEETPLILSIHVRNYDDMDGSTFNPERNPASRAYVAPGTPCRAHSGGFWGGTSEAFLTLSKELRDRTMEDLENGIIAIWHDQSHLIRYATEVPHYNVEKGIVSSEEYADFDKCYMIFSNKENYGGNNNLREISTKQRIRNFPKKVYSRLLKIATKLHVDKFFRSCVKLFKKSDK